MKKMLCLVVALILAIMLMVTTAFADGTMVYVENVSADAGDEVVVDVIISGNTGFAAAKVELFYDSSVLTLKGITTNLLSGGAVNQEKGIVSFASATDVTSDGVLMSATFAVAADAPDCVASVSVSVSRLANTSSDALNPTVYAGGISVTAAHVHSYTNAGTTAPTCDVQGYTTYKCACGDSYRDNYVSALGHKYAATGTSEPTCTEQGSTSYTCSVCGGVYHDNYVDALGHKYTKPAFTWKEDCSECTVTYSCTTCSEKFTEQCQMTSKTTPATEKTKGETVYTVTFELGGQTYTDSKKVVLPKLDPVVDPDQEPGPGVSDDTDSVVYMIIGVVIGLVVGAVGAGTVFFLIGKKKKKDSEEEKI